MHPEVERAAVISLLAHTGQVDKLGEPYFMHPYAVAWNVVMDQLDAQEISDPVLVATAYLHDVLEDTWLTPENLRLLGVSDNVVALVVLLTYDKDRETRDQYYERIKRDPRAVRVKLADIKHNMNEERMAALDPATRERLTTKYTKAMEALTS